MFFFSVFGIISSLGRHCFFEIGIDALILPSEFHYFVILLELILPMVFVDFFTTWAGQPK